MSSESNEYKEEVWEKEYPIWGERGWSNITLDDYRMREVKGYTTWCDTNVGKLKAEDIVPAKVIAPFLKHQGIKLV